MKVSEVSKVSKAPSDTITVKSITPYRGILDSDPSLTPTDCQSILTPRTVVLLTLTPAPGNYQAPPIVRLKRLLKTMLRAYGWRCTRCQPVAPAEKEQPTLAGRLSQALTTRVEAVRQLQATMPITPVAQRVLKRDSEPGLPEAPAEQGQAPAEGSR
jgi:hypothetical protein